jgi:hypothetical protein
MAIRRRGRGPCTGIMKALAWPISSADLNAPQQSHVPKARGAATASSATELSESVIERERSGGISCYHLAPMTLPPAKCGVPTRQRYFLFYPFKADHSPLWNYLNSTAKRWLAFRKPGSKVLVSSLDRNFPPSPAPGNDVRDRLHVVAHGLRTSTDSLMVSSDDRSRPRPETIPDFVLLARLNGYLGKKGRSLNGLPIKLVTCHSAAMKTGQFLGKYLNQMFGYRDFKIFGYTGLSYACYAGIDFETQTLLKEAPYYETHRPSQQPDGRLVRMSQARQLLYEHGTCVPRPPPGVRWCWNDCPTSTRSIDPMIHCARTPGR